MRISTIAHALVIVIAAWSISACNPSSALPAGVPPTAAKPSAPDGATPPAGIPPAASPNPNDAVSGSSTGQPGSPPNSSNLPSELTSVNPVNAAVVCAREQVRVDLRLTDATRLNGTFDISTVSLVLDGKDVTKTANVIGTMELPQSRASFSYAPATPMSAGLHRVSFTFATASQPKLYAWMFNVADKPC